MSVERVMVCLNNYIADYDEYYFSSLCVALRPLAIRIAKRVNRFDQYCFFDMDDYIQTAYITIWNVTERIKKKPEIVDYFLPYLAKAIKNAYCNMFYQYVKRSYVTKVMYSPDDYSISCGNMKYIYYYLEKKKEKRRLYNREYQRAHPRKKKYNKEKRHQYYINNKEKYAPARKQYWESHKEQLHAKAKIYREVHKEEIAKKQAEYRKTHREEINKRAAIYRAKHREELNRKSAVYREKKKAEKQTQSFI